MQHIYGFLLPVVLVGEGDTAVFNLVSERRKWQGSGLLHDTFVGIHDFEEASGTCVGFLQVVIDTYHALHGGDETCEEDDEEDKDRAEQLATDDGHAAEDEDEDQAEGDEHLGDGALSSRRAATRVMVRA